MEFAQPTDSETRVLREVLRVEGITQPAIVRGTGLSQQTVSRLVADLTERGALQPGAKIASGRRGQPSITVTLAADYACSLGVALMTDAMSAVCRRPALLSASLTRVSGRSLIAASASAIPCRYR